jgi:hypothetical protein
MGYIDQWLPSLGSPHSGPFTPTSPPFSCCSDVDLVYLENITLLHPCPALAGGGALRKGLGRCHEYHG